MRKFFSPTGPISPLQKNPERARQVKEVGADTIVSSSYIFNAADPKKAYEELCAI